MEPFSLIALVGIVVLLILSAFFSGSETALTAASRPRLTHLEAAGNTRATTALRLLRFRERLIGSVLLGNNLVNILASALATSVLITWTGEAGIVYATLTMTVLILVFAEVLPKTYALRYSTRSALAVAPVIKFIVLILSPIVVSIETLVGFALRMLGADKKAVAMLVSPQEEILSAIKLHTKEGSIFKDESDMLRGVFDLSETSIADVMVHRKNMVMIDAAENTAEITQQMLSSPFTRIPLWRSEPENIVGVLHAKDLLREIAMKSKRTEELNISKIMSQPWFVPETTSLLEQMTAFRDRHQHFALVVDEYGALMGLVTLEDIIEEIVGPIGDEYDMPSRGIRRQSDGSFLIEGTTPIRDINRDLGWSLPDSEAVTAAGLVIHESRSIPDVGQIFHFYETRFEILKRKRNQLTLLRISPLQQSPTVRH